MQPGSVIRLGLLALLWGSNFLLIAIALDGFTPTQILAGRLVLGAVVLVAVVYARGQQLPAGAIVWGHLAVAAVVANVIPYWLFAWAEQTIPSSIAGVLNATTPLATFALASIALHETNATRRRMLGLVVGFAGVALVMQPWDATTTAQLPGLVAALAASISYAFGYVYQRRHLTGRGLDALELAGGQLVAAAAMSLPLAALAGDQFGQTTVLAAVGLAALGAFGTGVAYVINFRLIDDEGPTSASTVTYLVPVVALVAGVNVLDETIELASILGAVAVLGGVLLAQNYDTRSGTNIE